MLADDALRLVGHRFNGYRFQPLWQVQREGGTVARRGGEGDPAVVLLDNAGVDHRETLAGPFAYLFCGEERFENVRLRARWNPAACIRNADNDAVVLLLRRDGDETARLRFAALPVSDRLGGVDDDIENGLIELAREALELWLVGFIGRDDFRHLAPLVLGNGDGAFDGFAQIHEPSLVGADP